MSEFIDDTEGHNEIKKDKSDPFMGLSLINPDEIEENLLLYKPKHKVGEKFVMDDTEYTIRQIIMDYDKNKGIQLYKYVFVPSIGQSPHNYKDTAYEIDRMIDIKPIRERKGQPLGGKHKSRRRRRRKSKKSKKYRKSKK
jgi:hypothetical protein